MNCNGKKGGEDVDFGLTKANEEMILSLVRSGRIPHTVIIEGGGAEERAGAATLLAAGAICKEADPPCLNCTACRKVLAESHPDLFLPRPSENLKTGILSLKELRDKYLSGISVKPNEADIKVYIFSEADKLLREDAQNALLKTIEEPPQRLLFIFTVESAKRLLLTVRSRARILTLSNTELTDEESADAARSLIAGIVSLYEYDLLLALFRLDDKEKLTAALTVLTEKLRAALGFYSGVRTDDEDVKRLTRKLDRGRVISLIEVTGDALGKLKTNVNMQLLTTWLCSQYRRLTWQK